MKAKAQLIDGMPVHVVDASVFPQQTILGSAIGVVFAVHVVTPEAIDPSYTGPYLGKYPNHVAFEQVGAGQRSARRTAVVMSLDETPKWDRGEDSAGNRRDITPGCYVLCKLTRQPSTKKPPDMTTAVKLYIDR